jgi:uncharacterized membrane protein YjgN (DUF898 family)
MAHSNQNNFTKIATVHFTHQKTGKTENWLELINKIGKRYFLKKEYYLIFVSIEKSMQFRFLNKTFKNKRFDFSPMHYDERKERLDLKKAQFESLDREDLSEEDRRKILRQNMSESWNRGSNVEKQRSSANLRVFLLVILILILGYFIFNGLDDVDVVVKKIM